MLFAFFDLVEEIKDLGRGTYQMRHIVRHVLLKAPAHVYEIFLVEAVEERAVLLVLDPVIQLGEQRGRVLPHSPCDTVRAPDDGAHS